MPWMMKLMMRTWKILNDLLSFLAAVQHKSAFTAVPAITEQHPIVVISSAGPGQPAIILGFSVN